MGIRWLRDRPLREVWLTRSRVVVATFSIGTEVETCHLPLHIFNHFTALDVSRHHKITALLLYIRDCILLETRKVFESGNILLLMGKLLKSNVRPKLNAVGTSKRLKQIHKAGNHIYECNMAEMYASSLIAGTDTKNH